MPNNENNNNLGSSYIYIPPRAITSPYVCNLGVPDGATCADKQSQQTALAHYAKNGEYSSYKDLVENFKDKKACGKVPVELCIYKNIINVTKNEEHRESAKKALAFFKVEGPSDGRTWLNNYNIDNVLERQIQLKKYNGNCCLLKFQMIDFDGNHPSCKRGPPTELGKIDIVNDVLNKGYNCLATVLNTDSSCGSGEHWFAVFCDFRKLDTEQRYTIEAFDSTGRPIKDPVIMWMEKTKARLESHLKSTGDNTKVETVTNKGVVHQKLNSECGVYSLFYILCRLYGTKCDAFRESSNVIPDDEIQVFRGAIFYK